MMGVSGAPLMLVIISLLVSAESLAIRNVGPNNLKNGEISVNVNDMISHCKQQVAINVVFPNELVPHKVLLRLATSPGTEPLIVTTNSNSLKAPCLYHGFNSVTKESLFAHEASGYLRSTFQSRGRWYKMKRPIHSTELATHAVPIQQNGSQQQARRLIGKQNLRPRYRLLRKEATANARHPMRLASFNGVAAMRVLELVVVADSGYVKRFGGHTRAIARIVKMINYVNGVYHSIGLQIVLVQAVTLKVNPFNVAQSSDALLRSFSTFKAFNIDIRHDAAILLISTKMAGSIGPGLVSTKTLTGWFSGLCHTFDSSGVVSDIGTPIHTAWLIAQTIGGLLGFSKDEDVLGCHCPTKNRCVMSHELSSEYRNKLIRWSTCSVEIWLTQTDAHWRSCLSDAPEVSFPYNSVTLCGNGIIDQGEECDCGPVATCKHLCCEPSSCRFRAGAICASGACCNTATCRLRPRSHVCRPKFGPCDVAETCDGATEWCPTDDRVADGFKCDNNTYCFGGECKSRPGQCQSLYGVLAKEADSKCYRTINVLTNAGFCHKTLMGQNNTRRIYRVVRCPAVDAMCGLLHCAMPERTLAGDTYHLGESSCSNQWTIDTSSSGQRSPAMVPDGASCGSMSMCVNSTCQPVSKFSCPDCPNCNGNGVLTRSKLCYCKPGFAPPDCKHAGCGGSLRSLLACKDIKSTTKTTPVTTLIPTQTIPSTTGTAEPSTSAEPLTLAAATTTTVPSIVSVAKHRQTVSHTEPATSPTASSTTSSTTTAKTTQTTIHATTQTPARRRTPHEQKTTINRIITVTSAPSTKVLHSLTRGKTKTNAIRRVDRVIPTRQASTTPKAPKLSPVSRLPASTSRTLVALKAATVSNRLVKLKTNPTVKTPMKATSTTAGTTQAGSRTTPNPNTSKMAAHAAPTLSSPKKSQLHNAGSEAKPPTSGQLFSGAISKEELFLVLPTILLSILVPLIAIAFIISAAVILVKVV